MNRAFDDLFGVAAAFDGIQMGGRTDLWIFAAAASRAGVELTPEVFVRFRDRYLSRLPEALDEPATGKCVLPGVSDLLSVIETRTDILPALLTGNCELGARIKLEHFGLWKFFRCGAYGDTVTCRNDLFSVAVERAQACGYTHVDPADAIVVGDTVLDVACAQASGARSLAVATGSVDIAELRASGADAVRQNLSNTEEILELLYSPRNRTRSSPSVQI